MKVFKTEDRVYLSDTDAGGIAYHTSYFNWTEHGRTELLRELFNESELGSTIIGDLACVVTTIEIDYKYPLHLNDKLRVESRLSKLGKVSALIEQEVIGPEGTACTMTAKIAYINKTTGRPMPLPADVYAAMEQVT